VQDDARQSEIASQTIDKEAQRGETLFITKIVLCEVVWVLESSYGYGRKTVGPVLERILRTRQFVFEAKDLLWQSLADYRHGKGDFSDYLIGHTCLSAGCDQVLSFDRTLAGTNPFELPDLRNRQDPD
jgi:predicted nucleic-acid-binding protein